MPHRPAHAGSYVYLDRYLDKHDDVQEAIDGLHNVSSRLEDYVDDAFIERGMEALFD